MFGRRDDIEAGRDEVESEKEELNDAEAERAGVKEEAA